MILIFAYRLYGRPSRVWPWIFGSAVVLSLVVFAAWIDPIVWMVFQRYGVPGPTTLFMSLSDALLLVVVLGGLAYIASGATGIARGRVNWVVAGIALAPILDLTWALANVVSTLFGNQSTVLLDVQHWTDALSPWFGLFGSVFVVYGFLSERVLDFRFAIGRAAIYAGVTAVLLLFFGIIEWWAEQIFESTRPAIYVSLFAALLIGFALNALHGRVETFLNIFFFRDQRRAEEALRHASRALANTSSERTLIEFLVDEPVRVLGLTEAALFLASRDGAAFVRTADRGWTHDEAGQIDWRGSTHRRAARRARADRARRPSASRNDLTRRPESTIARRPSDDARRRVRLRLLRRARERHTIHARRAPFTGSNRAQRRCRLRSH